MVFLLNKADTPQYFLFFLFKLLNPPGKLTKPVFGDGISRGLTSAALDLEYPVTEPLVLTQQFLGKLRPLFEYLQNLFCATVTGRLIMCGHYHLLA
jgi:hypothetical protein